MKVTITYRKRMHVLKMKPRNIDEEYDPCRFCSLRRSCENKDKFNLNASVISAVCGGTGYGFKEVKDKKQKCSD